MSLPDLIPVFALTAVIGILGAEEWVAHSIDQQGRGADGIRMADANGDGLLDIASGWEEEGESRVYLHPGTAHATKPWPKVVVGKVGPVEDAVFHDMDGDGFTDVMSASENKNIYFHWGPKDPEKWLNSAEWITDPLPAAKGVQKWMINQPIQLDGKNGTDLIAAGKGNQIIWFEAPSNARDLNAWKMHTISTEGGWTMGMELVDMDGDGDQDVLLGIRDQNPGVKWLENPGHVAELKDQWSEHPIGKPESTGFVASGDVDGDGIMDVVAPRMGKVKTLHFFRGVNKQGTQWEDVMIKLPDTRNKGIAIGDINMDGMQDLLVSHEFAKIYLLMRKRDAGLTEWAYEQIASGGKFDDVTVYDVDQDGDLDVLTTDERGLQVVWYENPAK